MWRRFDLRLELPLPTPAQRGEYIKTFFERRGQKSPKTSAAFLQKLGPASYAEIEQFCLDILRKHVLGFEQKPIDTLAQDAIASWQEKFTLQ